MRLTAYTDFSLRVLIYLALRPDRLTTIEEIAGAYGISESHLTKVAHRLGKLGLIDTLRGRNGGMRLKDAPETINIGATVRLMESNMVVVECFDPVNNTCPIAPVCALQSVLGDALSAFLAVLDRYTLADVIGNRRDLMTLLNLPTDPAAAEPAKRPQVGRH